MIIVGAGIVLSLVAFIISLIITNREKYRPVMDPPCIHTFDNNPIPRGFRGDKCLTNDQCYSNLKCCYEKPGFELLPTSGRCRLPEECGPNTTIQEWCSKCHRQY